MNGIDIFGHSIRQVFGNFGAAVRISAILYIIQFGFGVWLEARLPAMPFGQFNPMAVQDFPWGVFLLTYLVLAVTGLWIAVAWHRYVLLSEEPTSIIPAFRGDRMLAYFGYSILIALIMIPVVVVLSFAVSLLLVPLLMSNGPNTFGFVVLGLLVYVPLIVIGYRLSVVLPAVALEENLGIGGAWERTRGTTGTILVLAIASAIGFFILGLPLIWMTAGSVVAMVWSFVTQWIVIMVGVSILTTLYGHYVEERPLV